MVDIGAKGCTGPLGRPLPPVGGILTGGPTPRGVRGAGETGIEGIGGIVSEDRRVAVVGLGYVGLPLAISFAEAGLQVEGIDAFSGRVAELNAGSSPIDDVTNERLAEALADRLTVVGPEEPILRRPT